MLKNTVNEKASSDDPKPKSETQDFGKVFAMTKKLISSGSPYEPIVGFSRAVRDRNLVAIGGIVPLGPDGENVAPGDSAGQARRCLEIIQTALERAGATLKDVIRTRIFLTQIEDWEVVARVHEEFFGKVRPANTIMQVVSFVDPEWLVEIEADAKIHKEII